MTFQFLKRFGIIFGIITTFVTPVTPFLNPNMTYLLPMELNFTSDRISNFYINFGIQTMAHVNYASFYITNFLLFYLFCTNLTFELKFVSNISQKIGNIESRQAATINSSNNIKDLVQNIKLRSMGGRIEVKPAKQYDTQALLKAILKYHKNAIA